LRQLCATETPSEQKERLTKKNSPGDDTAGIQEVIVFEGSEGGFKNAKRQPSHGGASIEKKKVDKCSQGGHGKKKIGDDWSRLLVGRELGDRKNSGKGAVPKGRLHGIDAEFKCKVDSQYAM